MQTGVVKKLGNKWYVKTIEEGDWETFYPILPESLLVVRCLPGKEVKFNTVKGKARLLPGEVFSKNS